MKNKLLICAILGVWCALFDGIWLNEWTLAQEHHHEKHPNQGYHEAYHGGVLNVISKCEIGHIEVRVEEDLLEAWFVGGGRDTHRSVPIPDEEIALAVTFPDGRAGTLLLKAKPMKLAGEKIGSCSRFTARADWLEEINEFEAHGEIVFKGVRRPLIIKYPEGYAPGHLTK
jgi:hypothetical protein